MIEVLKQMVEALEHELCIDWTNNEEFNASAEKMHDAIQAGRQAIAELEGQEPVAYLCEPDENGLFGLPTPDKGCKDCFPVYLHPQRIEERNFCSRCGKRLGKRLDGIDSIHTCTPPMEKNT